MTNAKGAEPVDRVLACCFGGLPEEHFLDAAAAGLARMERAERRAALPSIIALLRPAVVLLPSADAIGIGLGSIAQRCQAAASPHGGRLVVVISALAGVRRAPGRTARFGADLVSVVSAGELAEVLRRAIHRVRTPSRLLKLA